VIDEAEGTNVLYAEFTDIRTDYNFRMAPEFFELYDLNKDPFQMKNIYSSYDTEKLAAFKKQLASLYSCQGDSCN
jgi:hypothetical protein